MNAIEFYKMSGSGNDFIIIDSRDGQIPQKGRETLARRLCQRKVSVGADGLILIDPSDYADFKWHFINADGSDAGMCGNGARCAARFAVLIGAASLKMSFETMAGLIEAEVTDDAVSIKMTDPSGLFMDETVTIDGQSKTIHRIDTGVPHAVLVVDDLDNIPVDVLGPAIRYHNHFAPEGTNVNFIQPAADGTVRIRTYERGVEAETLACGTGSVAGAIVASQLYNLTPPIRMIVMSGLPLDISFLRNSEGYREVYLKGEARVVYRGHLEEETW